jgi:hypothetical protein
MNQTKDCFKRHRARNVGAMESNSAARPVRRECRLPRS